MSKLLYWPSVHYFYPIGNTTAVSLTSDTPLEEPVKALLLGCGDPRHILFSIHDEPPVAQRTLDFTCCDFEPAVLARNVLLFSMIIDDVDVDTIFNIFFHFRVDKKCRTALTTQCLKLFDASETIHTWHGSPYGTLLRMSTVYTLSEIRRHWKLYIDMYKLKQQRRASLEAKFVALAEEALSLSQGPIWGQEIWKAAGPLVPESLPCATEVSSDYWRSGTTFLDATRKAQAKELNSTFVYSIGGEGSLHYATNPLSCFHLAAVIGNSEGEATSAIITQGARDQFAAWCQACRARFLSTNSTVIRFMMGEATSVCHTLALHRETGATTAGMPIAPWKWGTVELLDDEYAANRDGAPTNFNVIHTSNLEDHIGLLNIITAATSVLDSSIFAVLYTESFLQSGNNATLTFAKSLKGDLTVMGLLTGVVPVNYLCGFSSRCNTHELMVHNTALKAAKSMNRMFIQHQFHQVTTWKRPHSGDGLLANAGGSTVLPLSIDGQELGTFLYDVYLALYDEESIQNLVAAHPDPMDFLKATALSNIAHYTRESFVLLCKLIRGRLSISTATWKEAIDRVYSLQTAAWSIFSLDTEYFQDLWAHFNRHGLYRTGVFDHPLPTTGPFVHWRTVPELVRIMLVVPRSDLNKLLSLPGTEVGTPPLHCTIFGSSNTNNFSSIHAAFGRVRSSGTPSCPSVAFEADEKGWKGTSPLVVSFVVPAWLFVLGEPAANLNVGFCVRDTHAAFRSLFKVLGERLYISKAKLMDTSRVFILPESHAPAQRLSGMTGPQSDRVSAIGKATEATARLDEQCELLSSLTVRVSLRNPSVIHEFSREGSKCSPVFSQISPCALRMTLAGHAQNLCFPFPVQGDGLRMGLARKSRYVEVTVSPSRSFLPGGMRLNPYPVILSDSAIHPWSLHRVNLPKLPILCLESPTKITRWYNAHVGSMMSTRERSSRKKNENDTLAFIKDSIHTIFTVAAGMQGVAATKVFALSDEAIGECDTLIFVHHVRFDLAYHCLVLDAHVASLPHSALPHLRPAITRILDEPGVVANVKVFDGEIQAWKQLLPALAERCRTSWIHTPNCEYRSQGRVPLSDKVWEVPLCRCGEGKEDAEMVKNELWRPFAPYATPIALSPLFAVSYLETVGRSISAHRCGGCRGKGKPQLKECSGCRRIRYCSVECQKGHWKTHKPKCRSK